MRTIKVSSFKDLMNGLATARIKCLMRGDVVRSLYIEHVGRDLTEAVKIECVDAADSVIVPLDTPISYEQWSMDRGSLVFNAGAWKICTEGDLIHFPKDPQCYSIVPDPVKTAIVEAANLDLDDMRAENHLLPPNAFDAATHAMTLESLIDGEPYDDLGRVLQPVVDYLRRIH